MIRVEFKVFLGLKIQFAICYIFTSRQKTEGKLQKKCESVSCHSYPQRVFHSDLNCPTLVESGLDNGSFQAFLTRRLGRKEKLSALPPSQPIPSSSLIGFLYFFAELCLNPVPSYLASTHPTRLLSCQVWRERPSLSSLALRPQFEPMYHTAGHHYTVEKTVIGTVIVCLHYLCWWTVCGQMAL